MLPPLLLSGLVGYVLGSLPFGYWVARRHGINIFEHGSRNPGATNVRRVLGKGPGNLVFALDALKGAMAAGAPLVAARLGWGDGVESAVLAWSMAGLVGALLGHSFSCFTGFKGGKGVATTVGGFAVLLPAALVVSAVIWAIVFYSTRYVSLASMLAAVSLPGGAYLFQAPLPLIGISAAVAVFVIVMHRTNLVRLMNGTENKFVKKKADPSAG
ncbi:MAG: glycerol-3-phosphate 1-O-acyltransferase PlsY [Opitutaceae bacterium]|nr:glycerol-3-phosphate 1-O-acyltransferase PlsY [Opitutaceae bacterium]